MKSPSKQLLKGALLGDVVESLTGHDVIVQRSPSHSFHMQGSSTIRCSHTSRAFAGHTLVGIAEVIWEGAPDDYCKLLKFRMKDYLKENRVRPINESFDPENEVLSRRFTLKSRTGTLHVHEKLFLKQIQLLPRQMNRTNGAKRKKVFTGFHR